MGVLCLDVEKIYAYRRIEPAGILGVETNRAKIVAKLTHEGWQLARHGHDVYKHPVKPGVAITVPRHRELSNGVARQIAKVAGWR